MIILISFTLGIILESCCKGYKYRWEYLITHNLSEKKVTESDSIKVDDFGIGVTPISQKFAINGFNPFINKAYATSCNPTYTMMDSIIDIRVITMNELDESFPANSDVTDLFYAHQNYADISIEELIRYINSYEWEFGYFSMYLNFELLEDSFQSFLIEVELSDNRVVKGYTNEVWLYNE